MPVQGNYRRFRIEKEKKKDDEERVRARYRGYPQGSRCKQARLFLVFAPVITGLITFHCTRVRTTCIPVPVQKSGVPAAQPKTASGRGTPASLGPTEGKLDSGPVDSQAADAALDESS